MRLELSRFIEPDLDEIAAYIAKDNPRRALTFIREIRGKFRDIERVVYGGRDLPGAFG